MLVIISASIKDEIVQVVLDLDKIVWGAPTEGVVDGHSCKWTCLGMDDGDQLTVCQPPASLVDLQRAPGDLIQTRHEEVMGVLDKINSNLLKTQCRRLRWIVCFLAVGMVVVGLW